ncbi:hypothetical protein AAHC03_016464 [Spirometra sp. Aus1]
MDSQKIYCFDYVATHSALPRHRTCCPFMQRTLYRIIRNIARLDLGFNCPSGNTPQPPASGKKRKGDSVWKSFLHGRRTSAAYEASTSNRRDSASSEDSALYLPDAFTKQFPDVADEFAEEEEDEQLSGAMTERVMPRAQELEVGKKEADSKASGKLESARLKTKRKQLRRQKMREFDFPVEGSEIPFTKRSSVCSPTMNRSPDEGVHSETPIHDSYHMLETKELCLLDQSIGSSNRRASGCLAERNPCKQVTPNSRTCTVQVRRVHARRVSSASQTAKGSFEERENAKVFSPPAPKSQLQTPKAVLQIQPAVIPPFTVRDPVEKQVQNWLANTSDEYNILLNR